MTEHYDFIVVDDVTMNNMLAMQVIWNKLPGAQIKDFTDAESCINYLNNSFLESDHANHTILLLDIYMPVMDGWDFLEQFNKMNTAIQDRVSIFVLSSSISSTDNARAMSYKFVKGFFVKPLEENMIETIQLIMKN